MINWYLPKNYKENIMAWLTEHWFIEAILIIISGMIIVAMISWLYNQINKE